MNEEGGIVAVHLGVQEKTLIEIFLRLFMRDCAECLYIQAVGDGELMTV